jgi:lysophospholipase L1-like esterase
MITNSRALHFFVVLSLLLAPMSLAFDDPPPGTGHGSGAGLADANADAALPVVTETGFISLSVDGLGTNDTLGGIIQVEKPEGGTVRGAYLAAASTGFSARFLFDGDVKIDGMDVLWSTSTPSSSIQSFNHWADVTALVKPKVDAAPAGRVDFTITEVNPDGIDGEILAVILDDPTQSAESAVLLYFGAQNPAGDTMRLNFAKPLDLQDPNLTVDMSLGISFGAQSCAGGQEDLIEVNGMRLSTAAGGEDDGYCANGALLTVGGLDDDSLNPPDPFASNQRDPRQDDELYNLVPFVSAGDTALDVFTSNSSFDDNIFFAAFRTGITLRAPVIDYFAIGDSIASGHGLMDDGTACHRSVRGYPFRVANALKTRYLKVNFPTSIAEDGSEIQHFLACSGATALKPAPKVLEEDSYKYLKNQVDYVIAHLSDRPTLVSITIGANDLKWADTFNFYRRLADPSLVFLNWVTDRKTAVGQALFAQVRRLLKHENVSVVITQVHNPANRKSKFFSLFPGRPCANIFTIVDCYERFENAVGMLNAAYVLDVFVPLGRPERLRIARINAPLGKTFASPRFSCGSSRPDEASTLVQYIGDPKSNSLLPAAVRLAFLSGNKKGDCFHPNARGAQVYAEAVNQAALKAGR